MSFQPASKNQVIGALAMFHFIGVIGLNLSFSQEIFEQLTPISLLLTTGSVLLFHKKFDLGFFLFMIISMLVGFGIEVLGVHTKLIFGEYYYQTSLGPKIVDVPLMIAVNWFLLMYCCNALASLLVTNFWVKSIAIALFMVCIDFVIEPFAITHALWNWPSGHVPVQNYLAWFIISFLLAISTHNFIKRIKNPVAVAAFFIMLLFFVADKAVRTLL